MFWLFSDCLGVVMLLSKVLTIIVLTGGRKSCSPKNNWEHRFCPIYLDNDYEALVQIVDRFVSGSFSKLGVFILTGA